jgi:hypothetical protein
MAIDRELSQEEFDSLAPSDRAHYKVKGTLGDDSSNALGDDATKTARAAAFELDNAQADDADIDPDQRHADLEAAKEAAGVSSTSSSERVAETTEADDGLTDEDGEGHPQTVDEAVEAEKSRRAEMSEAEKREAELRDQVADGLDGGSDAANNAEIPNVGAAPASDQE